MDALFNSIPQALARAPAGQKIVVATDWRFCPLMGAEASERALARITQSNPMSERSAALASRNSPSAVLQFLRLVRESHHPSRRLFFDAGEMIAWLHETLAPDEERRLRQFLDEGAAQAFGKVG